MSTPLNYIDRETGALQQEKIYGEAELDFLYGTLFGKALRASGITLPWFSHLNALPKKYGPQRQKIREFASRYEINVAEAEMTPDQYPTLDAFFCRRLKAGARPVDVAPQIITSPADGRVLAYRIERGQLLQIKQQQVSVAELLQNTEAASELENGTAVVVRLAPKDYHRFHFPAAGVASLARVVGTRLESVHPIALHSGARSFLNKRAITRLDTTATGSLYMVEVGALTVGTIVQSYVAGNVQRGQEKGYFRFGGSTVVLLWGEQGPVVDADLRANSERGIETLVKYGTRIASML
jgi:phosphatidylserine decarboxylase